jgi:predicted PurR-regulated permease PerM
MFGLLVLLLFLVLIPLIQSEVLLAAKRLPDWLGQLTARIAPWVEQQFGISLALDLDSVKAMVAENMDDARDLSLHLLAGVKTGSLIIISVLVNLALIPVVMFYVLRDWNMIGERLDSLVPRDWLAKVQTIVHDIDLVLAEFLRGQVLVMIVLAAYYTIGLTVVGLDRALAIGVLTGLLVFIPYVGFGLGWSSAFWRLCSSGTAGRPSWRCWRSMASARCWRRMCWCRGWWVIASACIRWR